MGERHRPAGVNPREQLLGDTVAEQPAQHPERAFHAPHTVTVLHKESFTVYFHIKCSVNDRDTKFRRDIIANPYIMVTLEPSDFNARIGKGGQCAEETHISPRDDLFVFKPIVEYIPKKIQPPGGRPDFTQPFHDTAFVLAMIPDIGRSEMDVRYKICQTALCHRVKGILIRAWPPRSSSPCPIPAQTPD